MKITALALIASLMIPAHAYAADDSDEMNMKMQALAVCHATDISLVQLYTQIAASMKALSPENAPPQMALLRQSYMALAQDARESVKAIVKQIALTIPDREKVRSLYFPMMEDALKHLQHGLGTLDYDIQVRVQTLMLEQANACDKFIGGLDKTSLDK